MAPGMPPADTAITAHPAHMVNYLEFSREASSPSQGARRRSPLSPLGASSRPKVESDIPVATWTDENGKKKRNRKHFDSDKQHLMWYPIWALFCMCCIALIYNPYRSNHKTVQSLSIDDRGGEKVYNSFENIYRDESGVLTFGSNDTSSRVQNWDFGGVVHVIQTRFMQMQPDLIDLGLARLKIFRAFCLPTIVQQSSQNFIWIIRTDPDLDLRLKTNLIEILDPYPHYLLVASNENPEGFRGHGSLEFKESDVWSGSYALAKHFHEASQTNIVLESRLDADDGLYIFFVQNVQAQANLYLKTPEVAENDAPQSKWMVWCTRSHLEWQHSSPWHHTNKTDYGYLIGIKKEDCITPGLTTGYGLGTSRRDLPSGHHEKMHENVPKCEEHNSNATRCLLRFGNTFPGAVRARSPTSAGMKRVVIGQHGDRSLYLSAKSQRNLQNKMWGGLQRGFQVKPEETAIVRAHLTDHLVAICKDNLRGQCTKGHSCKSDSQLYLKKLIADPTVDDYN